MESHLGRLTVISTRSIDRDGHSSAEMSRQASPGQRSPDGDDDGDDDDTGSSSLRADYSPNLHVFRNQVDMIDRYHGPSSLYVLCNHFRLRALATSIATEPGAALQDLLQNMCDIAGAMESLPSYSDQFHIHLLPKQQAVTALDHFFKDVDYMTDIFVQSNLLANLERVYSQPMKASDEAWPICFKAIVLLVLGKEVSAQACNALFGDFARSLLPSRAALINSRLLATPRLINVQTLILLSVAAQQFDPHGWAEHLFTHACMLARTMGLHHAHHLPNDTSAVETLERAKVLRSLYTRDKSMCTTRGCIPWLLSDDCNIASQLGAAVERPAPFSDHFQLAIVQDDVYRLTNANSRRRPHSNSKLNASVRRIEQHLDQYMHTFGIFDSVVSNFPRRALIPLEFLATRILALQHGSEPSHAEQVRSDARASCQLLLIAHGDQDRQVVDAFNSLTCRTNTASPKTRNLLASEAGPVPFASILDAFSVPAFFILLEGLLQPNENDGVPGSATDLDLLRRVSACYNKSTGRMQPNSYHRKVALIFDRLLKMIELFKHPSQYQPGSISPRVSVAEMMLSNPSPPTPSLGPQAVDFSNFFTAFPQGDLSNLSFQPTTPANSSTSWDSWLSVPSSLGPTTPSTTANVFDGISAATPDLLAHVLGPSQCFPDYSEQSKQWPATAPEPSIAPKRRRTRYDSNSPM
ncbi:MAG: hypothetical protein Q9166_007530 [cf. Caloplaca sp. 2 TL-2023]